MKFVPTSVRPTYLPYRELYNYKSAARFLAEYMQFEQLEISDKYPTHLPSPASVLKWRAGDCFDFATVLTSILCGSGYDAYCVAGYAPMDVTSANQSIKPAPDHVLDTTLPPISNALDFWMNDSHLSAENMITPPSNLTVKEKKALEKSAWFMDIYRDWMSKDPVDKEDDVSNLVIEVRKKLESNFDIEIKEKLRKEEQARISDEMCSDSDEEAPKLRDKFPGNRVHCWVFIRKGPREVSDSFFIEPSTGQQYAINKSPYLKVDSVWNHKNMFICMQHEKASEIDWELANPASFEPVLPDIQPAFRASLTAGEDIKTISESLFLTRSADGAVERVIEAPPSWSEALNIPRTTFEQRRYRNHKILFYDKVTVEYFAPYSQPDGLIHRISKFKDLKRIFPRELVERYHQRVDKLQQKIREPKNLFLKEIFEVGRPDALASITLYENQRREFSFYPSRLDGLRKHEEIFGLEISQEYSGRDDGLKKLSVVLDRSNLSTHDTIDCEGGKIAVSKLSTWHSHPSELAIASSNAASSPADDLSAIKRIVFQLANESIGQELRIRVDYHTRMGSTLDQSIHYIKKDGKLVVDDAAMTLAAGQYRGRDVTVPDDDDDEGISSKTLSARPSTLNIFGGEQEHQPAITVESAAKVKPPRLRPRIPEKEDFQSLLTTERDCLVQARDRFDIASKILHDRKMEESRVDMRRSLFALESAFSKIMGGAAQAAIVASQTYAEHSGNPPDPNNPNALNQAITMAIAAIARNDDGTVGLKSEDSIQRITSPELNAQLLLFHSYQQSHGDGQSSVASPFTLGAAGNNNKEETNHIGADGDTVIRTYHARALLRAQSDALRARNDDAEEDNTGVRKTDVLAPYLIEYGDTELTAAEAEFVAKRCKADFRKRLLERAAIIQRRLDEEHEKTRRRRMALQHRSGSQGAESGNGDDQEKQYEKEQQEAAFRIHILEHRLARHEAQAVKKFAELERILAEHPRLRALHGQFGQTSSNNNTISSFNRTGTMLRGV